MKGNNKHISKEISNFYIESKQKQIKHIQENNEKLEKQIEIEKGKLEEHKNVLDKEIFENNLLKDEYSSLKRVIKERGIVIDITNDNYSLKEWDNLNLKREGNSFILSSKKGETLKSFDNETSELLQDASLQYGMYSAIVIRVTPKYIRVQIRLIDNEM